MDPSLLLMLSDLLHLQNHLDPTTSLLSDSQATVSSLSSTAAPLLFFTISSVLSSALHRRSSSSHSPSSNSSSPSSPPTNNNERADKSHKNNNSNNKNKKSKNKGNSSDDMDLSISAFKSLTKDRIWSMDPLARDAQWRSSYGLSYSVFASLVDHLKPYILRSNLSLPADYAVAMVLSRLAHAHSPAFLGRCHSLDPFLVSKITNMVTRLLATKLYSQFVKIPVGHRLLQLIHSFKDLTSLPNLCGAIDSTPIHLSRFPDDINSAPFIRPSPHGGGGGGGSYPAVLLQAVSDHRNIFWDVCVKAPGGTDDAAHFRDSTLYRRLTSADILRDSVISVRGHHVRPYIVGDHCFPLLPFLLTPFNSSSSSGTPAQNAFDAALMRGRTTVEHAIGLLKGRWRILQNLNVGLNHAPQTIVACCVLHNICQIAGEPELELYKDPPETGPLARPLENEKSFYYFGENLRQAIADDLQERQQRLLSR